jgi:predicted nucleic acid-binding protein
VIKLRNAYWDSCVFYCLLTGKPPEHQADVLELLADAKKGSVKIYCSTMTFAEIRQKSLRPKGHLTINDFFQDLGSAVATIDPNPNIMIAAGELRDAEPTNPSDVTTTNKRSIGIADAIHLETCLYLRDVLNIKDIEFQTFDAGKGRTWEGRCVPLLGFERWFPEATRTKRVRDVCGLTRKLPQSSQPNLFTTGIGHAAPTLITDGRTPS